MSQKGQLHQFYNKSVTIGMFVQTRLHPFAVVVGPSTDLDTYLMLPSGELVCVPYRNMRETLPPTDVDLNVRRGHFVFVIHGRLTGMFGRVLGTTHGRLFVRNGHGSVPRQGRECTKQESIIFTVCVTKVKKQRQGMSASIMAVVRNLWPLKKPLFTIKEEPENEKEKDD